MKGIIKEDTIGSGGGWHQNMIGQEIEVKRYKHKGTSDGDLDCCSCDDCQSHRRGKKMYTYYEVISGYSNPGSIIPDYCIRIAN